MISPLLPQRSKPTRVPSRLDRLNWAAGMCVVAHGVRLGFRTNDPPVLEQVPAHLPAGWEVADRPHVERLYSIQRTGPSPRYLLYRGARRLAPPSSLEEVLAKLEFDVELHVVEMAPERVFVHAGVVGWQGRALVIPGRSYSGKSTLVAALCAAGATYYSDEYAVFDPQGRVHPYPRLLHLRQAVPGVANVDSAALSSPCDRPPLPLGRLLLTWHEPGARWGPRPISPGQAILNLLANTMSARRRPLAALAVFRRALASAGAVTGPRGEAADLARHLLAGAS